MLHTYQVAGHCFSIELEDHSPLWDRLENYTPFLADNCRSEALFTVRFVDRSEPFRRVPFYMEKDAEPDQPRMEVYREALEGAPQPDFRIGSGSPRWVIEMAPVQKMPICARIVSDGGFRTAEVSAADNEKLGLFAINNAAMLLFAFNTATKGTLEMHASVIANGGRGYLFLGKSGTGKSTHSSLWLKHIAGSELLNDDNPVVRLEADGTVRVYGTPWSGKTPCYRNLSVPVGGFVRIRQHPENIIHRSGPLEAYASLYPSCSGLRPIQAWADGMHETIGALIASVPCYELQCLPDEGAARLCADTVRL